MQTFDRAILKGYEDGLITEQTALAYASQRSLVRRGIDDIKAAHGEKTYDLGVELTLDQEYDRRVNEERQKAGAR
jgi:twitching motility protein PilT